MNTLQLQTKSQDQSKKPGPKVKPVLLNLSPEERLNTLADIIIERIFEERNKKIQAE